MTPERWQQIETLYHAALERAPETRAAFLADACAEDSDLQREVEALLRGEDATWSFIEGNALEAEARHLESADLSEAKMPSLIGRQLGAYQILAPLGKGGMGEVYRARDTKLDRTVALKILPAAVATDAERMRRFVSEAKAASALNHPHVATIYEIGEAESVRFIAMEYVAGQTLAAKINGTPLAIPEIVELGSQIADALDEAHSKGITHRDIKPANVMVTPRGQVKVLDFGLAKIARPQPLDSQLSTLAKTQSGVVMGTVPYMSPEQALGRDVDYRSDIFSFGAVLYEMTTGRLPFGGSGTGETLDRILHAQPDAMAQFNADAPKELERIVRKCLEKERERRYQSAQKLRDDLKNLQRESASTLAAAVQGKSYRRVASFAVALLLLAGIGLAYFAWRSPQPPRITGSTTLLSNGHRKATMNSGSFFTALVTDGTRLYFSELVGVQYLLAQMPVTGGEAVILPTPFRNTLVEDISPNKAELLVSSREAEEMEMPLWILPVAGGSPRRLGNVLAHGATWSPDGKEIVYAKGDALYRMKSDGTASRPLMTTAGRLFWPRWSPDGSRLRFTVIARDNQKRTLWEVAADGSNAHPLLAGWPGWPDQLSACCGTWTADGKSFVFEAASHLTTSLWALRDTASLFQRAKAEPVQLTVGPLNYHSPVPSLDGRRLFAVGDLRRGELVRYDAKAQQFVNYLGGISAEALSFSRDGEWIAYASYPEGDLWRSRTDGSQRLQITFPPMQSYHPRWSPDGKKIVFEAMASSDKPRKTWLVAAQGGSLEELLPSTGRMRNATWSPDGNALLYAARSPANLDTPVLLMLNLNTRQIVELPGSAGLFSPRWSPDGRYAAALNIETQVLLLYDFTTQKWRELAKLSVGSPAWSQDGKYIYFANSQQQRIANAFQNEAALFRVNIDDGKLERITSLNGLRRAIGPFGPWMGLAPDDSPLVLRDVGTQDIYALDWQPQ